MTIKEIIISGSSILNENNIENSRYESECLLQNLLNISRTELVLSYNETVPDIVFDSFINSVKKRSTGYPLQYILGSWDFMGLNFRIGEGVLIPRPETEILVEKALKLLNNIESPTVFDLCSGSGCIGITLAKSIPGSKVYCVDNSLEALRYLEQNIKLNMADNAIAVNGDIFDNGLLRGLSPDLIVSNPPYINTDELAFLQKEVLFEPVSALDGGSDGLSFYRELSKNWFNKINSGGFMVLECGERQSTDILSFFNSKRKEVILDYNNIERILCIYR